MVGEENMKKKVITLVIFVCSLAALVISLYLFYNMGIYVDEKNTSPAAVCGGEFWMYMDWLRLALLALITVLSGVKLVQKDK